MFRTLRGRHLITVILIFFALASSGVATALPSQAQTSQHNIMLYEHGQWYAVTVCGYHNGAYLCSGCVLLKTDGWVSANLALDNNTNFIVVAACNGGHNYYGNFNAHVPGNDGLTNYWLDLGYWPTNQT
jgi:hypothetical protein